MQMPITQKTFAEKIGIKQSTWSLVVSCERHLSYTKALRVAQALKTGTGIWMKGPKASKEKRSEAWEAYREGTLEPRRRCKAGNPGA